MPYEFRLIYPYSNQEVQLSVSPFMYLYSSSLDDGRTKPVPRKGHTESFEPADNKCLLRASDGKKKISTVVSYKRFLSFYV